jgi:hypothetical protein
MRVDAEGQGALAGTGAHSGSVKLGNCASASANIAVIQVVRIVLLDHCGAKAVKMV